MDLADFCHGRVSSFTGLDADDPLFFYYEVAVREVAKRYYKEMHEAAWWSAGEPETITLYHGTSSVLVPRIKRKGLKPWAREDLIRFYLKLMKVKPTPKYLAVDKELRRDRTDNRVYMSTRFGQAEMYAKSNAEYGGEIAAGLLRAINIDRTKQGLEHLKPVFAGAKPVVLTLEVPFKIIQTYRSFKKIKKALIDQYRSSGMRRQGVGLKDYLNKFADEYGAMEAHVIEPVKPEWITKITTVG